MCVSCREMLPKSELIRIAKSQDGKINVDTTGKLEGRGAYICKLESCISKCIKTRGINRSFKMQVPQDIYQQLSTFVK